jgi:hypothetical protein
VPHSPPRVEQDRAEQALTINLGKLSRGSSAQQEAKHTSTDRAESMVVMLAGVGPPREFKDILQMRQQNVLCVERLCFSHGLGSRLPPIGFSSLKP